MLQKEHQLTKATKEKIGKKQLVIVDIGGRTTDVCLFKDKQIKSYKTIGIGMLNVYNDIVTTVNELYTQNFNLEDGEEILTDGLFLDGEDKNVDFIKPILTGGGATVFKKAFSNRLKNLIVSSDNLFDNVKGFKKVGEQLWG